MFSFDHESLPKHVGTSGIQTLNDGNGYLPNFYGVLLKKHSNFDFSSTDSSSIATKLFFLYQAIHSFSTNYEPNLQHTDKVTNDSLILFLEFHHADFIYLMSQHVLVMIYDRKKTVK